MQVELVLALGNITPKRQEIERMGETKNSRTTHEYPHPPSREYVFG
ncbi:hypothetical protein HKBW3S44_01385 [Candidatus Hakubella thermalkaliphila]|uniref:Uncharacterized protein n=1 Tax=Candidatus Hakubella thermalkaliphila TaxID=2754717 RepID=A0A6V8PYX9_9ACTN|nr:hypothetical protein HKBW3S44_01385 [Candidatus Hakubella thermalkaliphila]